VPAIARTLDGLLRHFGETSTVGLHGGECTTIPIDDLEALLRIIAERTGSSGVQTNGYALTPELIRVFKEYSTTVSVSWDGPAELNALRGPDPGGSLATSGYHTGLVENVKKLLDADLRVSIVCVLHMANASSPEKLRRMKEWIEWLEGLGIDGGRLNPLFEDSPVTRYELDDTQLEHAYLELLDFVVEGGYEWLPFREMIDNLLGFPISPCVFAGCDRASTHAISILPDGRLGNCDRTFVEGLETRILTAPPANERSAFLQKTQCAGCRYWALCQGGCPMSGDNGSWRNKTRFCRAYFSTYERTERMLRGLLPNIRLVMDRGDGKPFEAMSWRSCKKPSAYAAPVWREATAIDGPLPGSGSRREGA
jgi:uncharacterized protein